jgi:hypothetical protein
MLSLVIILIGLVVYFAPTIAAQASKSKRTQGVFVVNLLLGWSVIGWIVALIWAVGSDKKEETEE